VSGADRQRRARRATARLAQIAPAAAGLALVTAALGRMAGWSPVVAIGVVAVLAAVLAAYVVVMRRPHPSTDAIAARIDADAEMAGELRSAHWFAATESRDEWADYHMVTAAERASQVSWDTLYPPVRAARAWVITGALVAGAIALAVVVPGTRAAAPTGLTGEVAEIAAELPPELQAKLEALFAQMGDGKASAEAKQATLEDLKKLMEQIDPKLQAKLAELLKKQPLGDLANTKRKDLDEEDLNERNDNSAAGMPEDVRWALEDLAARMANADANRKTNENNPAASSETGETAKGSAQAETSEAGQSQQAGMQLMREAASDAGGSQMMMAGAGAMGGDSSNGPGGNSGGKGDPKDFASIAQALRKELIEANQDIKGENIPKEDIRRKTEHGQSSLGFTRVAPPANFDRSRATSPPQVPDARRPLLFHYFIRQR
jgi:hypothetical protein